MLARKIIAASVSGTLFAVLLGFIAYDPFGGNDIGSIQSYVFSAVSIIPLYMIYSFPVILIYGVLTSIISDKIGGFIAVKAKEEKAEGIVSGALHVVFGLILFWISLGASILFFITDRVLKRRNSKYTWFDAVKSLALPILVWFLSMMIFWMNDL